MNFHNISIEIQDKIKDPVTHIYTFVNQSWDYNQF